LKKLKLGIRIIFFLAFGIFPGASVAQSLEFPQLNGFKIKTDYPVYSPGNLWDFIDGAADNYLASGFVDLHVAEYKKGKAVIKLEIYRHSGNTMAFGIYSSERSPSFRFINLGAQGYIIDGSINFFKGSYYVKIRTYSKKEKVLLAEESLANKVAAMLTGEAAMPALLSRFPAEGKKVNEETYINESVLGHSFLNKSFKAAYQVGTDEFAIYLVDGSSSEEIKKTAETYIASTGIAIVETGDSKFMISDGYNGTIFLAWKDKRLVIISGLAKDQAEVADRYTSEILK
jgi:hypothetical protein